MLASETIQRKEVVCQYCQTFSKCKSIDETFHSLLVASGGNYRSLKLSDGSRVPSPIRRCSDTIFHQHEKEFRNKEILEIGCGKATLFNEEFIKKNNIRYTGIDFRQLPHRGIPMLKGDRTWVFLMNAVLRRLNRPLFHLINLSHKYSHGPRAYYIRDRFPSQKIASMQFDIIFASSSMEHWHEDLCPSSSYQSHISESLLQESVERYKRDLRFCYERLRKGGMLLIDCPIHVHGNHLFYQGRLEDIYSIFESVLWSELRYEHWRRDHSGLAPYMTKTRRKFWLEVHKRDIRNMWLLNVIAIK